MPGAQGWDCGDDIQVPERRQCAATKSRAAIEEAISALNYTVNQHARGLKTNRSMTIGAVIPELNNTFITTIMNRVSDTLRQHGYALIIIGCRSDEAIEREAMRFLLEKRVDGIINMPVASDGEQLKPVLERGTRRWC